MEQNINDNNLEDSHSDENKKNEELYNVEISLGLKTYETTIFRYFISLNRKNVIPNIIEYLFIFIETIQLFSLFYNSDYIPYLPDSLKLTSKIFTLKNVVNPDIALIVVGVGIALIYLFTIINFIMTYGSGVNFPVKLIELNLIIIRIFFSISFIPVLFSLLEFINCSNNEEDTTVKYICFNGHHLIMMSISLVQLFLYILFSYFYLCFSNSYIPLNSKFNSVYSNKTLSTFKTVILIEILNIEVFQVYFKIQYISSIVMFLGFVYLLYIHYNYQCYYNKKLNSFYSAIWFSMALTSFVYVIFTVINIKLIYPVFMGISAVGIIIGWYLNNFFFNLYSNKIFFNIERKYNQQHIISRLKEEIEMDHINDDETNSIETIVTTRKIIKKEKVYKKPSDCAYVSKFILNNRSLEAFKLVDSLFKEGISQFERTFEIYLQYWFYLHGIQNFISINKRCYKTEEANEYINQLKILSEKILHKCAKLSVTIFQKFIVFNAIYIYEMDKIYLASGENSSNKEAINFELIEIRHKSIQYHLAALNTLKNLMESLKHLNTDDDIDNSMKINDILIEILNNGESLFKKFVLNSNYSKETLELYILFLRNSMNRADLAGQYFTMLEENERLDDDIQNENILNKDMYEKSEKMSSINSDGGNRKIAVLKKNMLQKCQEPLYKLLHVMQLITSLACVMGIICNIIYYISFKNIVSNVDYFYVAAEAPMVMSRIKSAIRLISLVAASGLPPAIFPFGDVVQTNLKILENDYFPLIYRVHSKEPTNYYTFHPIYDGVVDEVKNVDYYKAMLKIYKKSQKILDGMNRTSILTPSYLYDYDVRFLSSNTKGNFGNLFLNSLDITKENVYSVVNKHEMTFYVIVLIISAFILYNIIGIIIPNTNKNYHFIKNMISLYKTLPSKFFNDQCNDYVDQIQEICENYEIEDEGTEKRKKMKKNSSTKNVKLIFIIYSFIITLLLLFPFMTVFLYKNECQSLTNFLINSTKRIYYLASINLYDMEILIKDRYYYRDGEEIALMTQLYETLIKLENGLKNGEYGGKSSSQYSIFNSLSNNPGCLRSKEECDARIFNEYYTKELSESTLDYQMVEYLNKLNEYINNPPIRNYDLTNQGDLANVISDIANSPNIHFFKNLSDDMAKQIDKMNEIGTEYLVQTAHYYTNVTLIGHCICSILIFILFYIFVSRPVKKQLRVIDSLNNIIFSIPHTLFNTSPKLKNYIENGKIE